MQSPLRTALPSFLRSLCQAGPAGLSGLAARSEDGDFEWMNDPEKVEYVERLLDALYEARTIVNCYNLAILLVLMVLALQHRRATKRDQEKWRRLTQQRGQGAVASSCSSTVAGTVTPPDAKDVDVESAPLLAGRRETTTGVPTRIRISRTVRSWLTRQPCPLPVINRTLPSNGTSLFILAWLALNISLHFFRLPMQAGFFFILADRTGCVFVVNLPLLYLLGAKNQPLRALTGYSYEALNIFHRRVGELLCFEAALHFVSMLLWQFFIAEEWLVESRSAYLYFTHPMILCGIGALVAYEALYFTSLGSFRQRWYELFLATHVLLQAAALVLLWFHYETSQPYVALALFIFLGDRLVWRLTLKRADLRADLCVLDKDSYLLSADWDIPRPPLLSRWSALLSIRRQSVLHGWHPTDHVFLTVPALGRTHALQAHPFTIASAAPGRPHEGDYYSYHDEPDPGPHPPPGPSGSGVGVEVGAIGGRQRPRHAWLTLLIRAHDGFTRDLLRHAQQQQQHHQRLSVRLDGPYGSPRALDMLRASACAVLVAGGSGIAVAFPLVWALLCDEDGGTVCGEGGEGQPANGDARDDNAINPAIRVKDSDGTETIRKGGGSLTRKRRRVHLLWVTHSREHREWVPGAQLAELVRRGLDLVVPEPTAEAGRPDVAGLVQGWVERVAAEGSEVGVVVSGPDGLNWAVRNVCADEIGRGREVRVVVEKFGW
ncbi:hypothetical protein N658DRAFT_494717 [Parathielavia hyrcaniae]|uniref:FAD-binding FR-type domain-containing protein n=1 Tax=Parathielavia hyrcaniae TaxID=113614 RepID=A0AAN6Q4D9_9PEZI|nr:hypothetical protein N658DRAFT_494717 [Parathielavia hyrcaniae]